MNRSRVGATLNNYSVEEEEAIRNAPCAYMLFGRERGDEEHLISRLCTHFKNEKSLKQLKALMPGHMSRLAKELSTGHRILPEGR